MCKGRTHVRVCISTAELLDAIRVRVQLAEEVGHIKRWWEGETLTMAELVDKVVRSYWDHMERARHKSKGRKRGRSAGSPAVNDRPVSEAELVYGQYELAEIVEGIAQRSRKRSTR